MTPSQTKIKTLAREALKLVEDKAPAIVDEQILPHMLDEVAEFTGDIMGKLTNLDAENDIAITMAYGIIQYGLFKEISDRIEDLVVDAEYERITKLFKK